MFELAYREFEHRSKEEPAEMDEIVAKIDTLFREALGIIERMGSVLERIRGEMEANEARMMATQFNLVSLISGMLNKLNNIHSLDVLTNLEVETLQRSRITVSTKFRNHFAELLKMSAEA